MTEQQNDSTQGTSTPSEGSTQPPGQVHYDKPAPAIARATLDRTHFANLLDVPMMYQLDDAYKQAAADDEVKVFILAAEGDDFCLGHDGHALFETDGMNQVSLEGGFDDRNNVLGDMAWESEAFLEMHWRWRNFPKPSIAQVQGKVIAGGLQVAWPCDIIIASDDAQIADPVVPLGMNGLELHLHHWEIGARRAKEWLFTGDSFTAEEAREVGLVNRVVGRAELESATLALAEQIATRPLAGLTLAKKSINQALDIQGQWAAVQNAFNLHTIGHASANAKYGQIIDPRGIELTARDWGHPGLDF